MLTITGLSDQLKSLIMQICEELKFSAARKEIALAWCKGVYERGGETPDLSKPSPLDRNLERLMSAFNYVQDSGPAVFHELLDAAADTRYPDRLRQQARAIVKERVSTLAPRFLAARLRVTTSSSQAVGTPKRSAHRIATSGPADSLHARKAISATK
jgi:hypothetical protein